MQVADYGWGMMRAIRRIVSDMVCGVGRRVLIVDFHL